jgi:heme exporter protein C
VPIIYWSINCPDPNQCAALHQRSSMAEIEGNILFAMLALTFAFWMYSFGTSLLRVRSIILEREAGTSWVDEQLELEARR